MATRGKYKLIGTEWVNTIKELTREKVSAMLQAIFQGELGLWLGVMHVPSDSASQSDRNFFEAVLRRFRELQRTPFESLSPRLVQQITNMLLDVDCSTQPRNLHYET